MLFNQIIGQEHIKKHLITSAENGRIPHAQLFVGKEGCGTLPMAIAYAQFLLCNFSDNVDACNLKCNKLQHPDLHFAFPVTTNDSVKKHAVSNLFLEDWRDFIATQPYGSLFNWLQHIGVENKQGLIGVDEAEAVVKKLKLKSYEGGFKVMIIWLPEKMNQACSNKLLKMIEVPPSKTLFILITENEEGVIGTIRSRAQLIKFPFIDNKALKDALLKIEGIDKKFSIINAPKTKEYIYLFSYDEKCHPFCAPLISSFQEHLDIELMKSGALLFEGTHNFKQYCTKPKPGAVFERKILESRIIENTMYSASFFPVTSYAFIIRSKGFLRYQVRLIMGQLLSLGRGEISLDDIRESLKGTNNRPLRHIAPASGLILNKIEFEQNPI